MQDYRTKDQAYDRCITEGSFKPIERIEIDKVKVNLKIAEEDLLSAQDAVLKKRGGILRTKCITM